MKVWTIKYHPEALRELIELDGQAKALAKGKLKQISSNPYIGVALGNKHGIDLSGFFKTYFFRKKYRIVFSIDTDSNTIYIISINKREDLAAYIQAFRRRK